MNEAEYLMKNYGDRGAEADNTLRVIHRMIIHMIRKPISILVLLFIQNISPILIG